MHILSSVTDNCPIWNSGRERRAVEIISWPILSKVMWPDCGLWIEVSQITNERAHDKPTKWHVCPAKTQISLGICPVWSVFAVRMKKAWVLSYPLSAQRRLWSDWADAQADLRLRWAHKPLCWFCHEATQSWCTAVSNTKPITRRTVDYENRRKQKNLLTVSLTGY